MGQEPDWGSPAVVRLAISVEGPTEEKFIKMVMVPHLQDLKIYAKPVILGRGGGNVSLLKIQKDLNKLAGGFDKVSTLYDFYGFKGKDGNESKESL